MKYSIDSIRKDFRKGRSLKFLFFWGHQKSSDGSITKSCFSQWWASNFQVENVNYSCMEQYMMAQKARLFNDYETLDKITKAKDPKKIKALGRQVKNFSELLWKENRYDIVLKGNLSKFTQNEELKIFLIATKNKIIVEASPYDKIWGIGMSANDKAIENPLLWKGENLLGFALMEVRDYILEI